MMYWDGGSGWAWMAFMPLLWIALIGLVVWAVVRLAQHPASRRDDTDGGPAPTETPEEVLDHRFASGEIGPETYAEMRKQLSAHRPRSR
ncbi:MULTISPECIES: SHOCT domain-containing protein [Streptomyces]|uniref:SHOCT domain-containing protein n=1 Tax=Streptomyces TaxID=1883 RepID=UPI00292F1F0E|nr:hypothetical protein [Streptomyces sp. NEAU-HV9]